MPFVPLILLIDIKKKHCITSESLVETSFVGIPPHSTSLHSTQSDWEMSFLEIFVINEKNFKNLYK